MPSRRDVGFDVEIIVELGCCKRSRRSCFEQKMRAVPQPWCWFRRVSFMRRVSWNAMLANLLLFSSEQRSQFPERRAYDLLFKFSRIELSQLFNSNSSKVFQSTQTSDQVVSTKNKMLGTGEKWCTFGKVARETARL